MSDPDVPDRLFAALRGRTAPAAEHVFEPTSLIVAERHDTGGLGLEEAEIITRCGSPVAVVELAAHTRLPLGAVTVLLSGLLDQGRITAHHPRSTAAASTAGSARDDRPSKALIERVLIGLRKHP